MNTPIKLYCKDCGDEFVFSGKEQDFFARKSFPTPLRCKKCRVQHKAKYGGKYVGLESISKKLTYSNKIADCKIYGLLYCVNGFR